MLFQLHLIKIYNLISFLKNYIFLDTPNCLDIKKFNMAPFYFFFIVVHSD